MLGERLLDLRKDAGLTQDELAAILNINKHSISSYERDINEPSDAVKIEIAKYFQVSIDYLLGITNDPCSKSDHSFVIRLPESIPEQAKESLTDYADFIKAKYSVKPTQEKVR